jgi:hypothetical protein
VEVFVFYWSNVLDLGTGTFEYPPVEAARPRSTYRTLLDRSDRATDVTFQTGNTDLAFLRFSFVNSGVPRGEVCRR